MNHLFTIASLALVVASPGSLAAAQTLIDGEAWDQGIRDCLAIEWKKDPNSFGLICRDNAEALDGSKPVSRKGAVLTIMLDNGKSRRLIDPCTVAKRRSNSCGDDVQVYAYVGFLSSIHQHLIKVNHYEHRDFLLVDSQNGKQTRIQNWPIFSPDGTSFVTAAFDIEGGLGPNGLEIWSLLDGVLKRRFSAKLSWGPKNPVWVEPHAIEVRQVCADPKSRLTERGVVQIVQRNGRWILNARSCS